MIGKKNEIDRKWNERSDETLCLISCTIFATITAMHISNSPQYAISFIGKEKNAKYWEFLK